MPAFDDDLRNYEEPRPPARDQAWNLDDDGPGERDRVPDEMATIRCTQCRKYIFEDSIRCPYCKHLQLESDRRGRPIWFVATVIFCVTIASGLAALFGLGMWPWY